MSWFLCSTHVETRQGALVKLTTDMTAQDARGRLRKIDSRVAFPFQLNVGAYCEPLEGGTLLAPYQLVGVVEHSGSMRYRQLRTSGFKLPANTWLMFMYRSSRSRD